MTEPIQWGGELPWDNLDLSDVCLAEDGILYDHEAREALTHQIRLIGQFWTEVAEEMEWILRCEADQTVDKEEAAWSKGYKSALKQILELSKKYPFG
jgi:hypothetical protein